MENDKNLSKFYLLSLFGTFTVVNHIDIYFFYSEALKKTKKNIFFL